MLPIEILALLVLNLFIGIFMWPLFDNKDRYLSRWIMKHSPYYMITFLYVMCWPLAIYLRITCDE